MAPASDDQNQLSALVLAHFTAPRVRAYLRGRQRAAAQVATAQVELPRSRILKMMEQVARERHTAAAHGAANNCLGRKSSKDCPT